MDGVPAIAYFDFYKTNGSDTVFNTEGPSLTRQEFAEECDINSLMRKYEGHVVGGPGNLPPLQPLYYDFADAPQTLMEFMEMQQRAESAFMSLPAVVRKEFENDPIQFVEFASDPANLEQMRTWGLAEPAKPADAPAPVEAPPEPAAAPANAGAP